MPAYKDYAGDIHNSGVHLLGLINEILDLSRIEAGRYELNEEPVALAHVVAECSHLLQMRAKSRGLTIHEVFETDMPRLWADERAVRQICLNLLSNAIKFTPQGGEIWLKAGWTASGGQYMSVKDTGPGIPEEEIPIVLASFGQGSNSIKSAEQGAGLGLPIAKSLVDLHGGTFALKSKLRIGTEVIVTFPPERVMSALAPLAEPAPPIQPPRHAAGGTNAPPPAPRPICASLLFRTGMRLTARRADTVDCVPHRDAYLARHVAAQDAMADIESPCNKVCVVDPVSALCVGCGRSLAEIAAGSGSRRARARIMADLPRRLRRCRRRGAAPTPPEGRRRAPPPALDPARRAGAVVFVLVLRGRRHARRAEPPRPVARWPIKIVILVFVGALALAMFRERFRRRSRRR